MTRIAAASLPPLALTRAGSLLLTGAGLVLALGAGLLTRPHPAYAVLVALVPFVVGALLWPAAALVPATALLVFPNDVAGGRLGSLQVAVSDVLLAIALIGMGIALWTRPRVEARPRALRPMMALFGVYLVAYLVAFAAHPSMAGVASLVQRVELVGVALLAGASLASTGHLLLALKSYVAVAAVFSVVVVSQTLLDGTSGLLGVQKNPAGQALAAALLLALGLPSLRGRPVLVLLLTGGLLATLSRGALLAAGLGVVVLAVCACVDGTTGERRRLGAAFGLGLVGLVVAFAFLPAAQQHRLLTLSPSRDYADQSRVDYARDALTVFRGSPVVGVGPGNYRGGPLVPYITDPHDVLLLELAEGGAILGVGYVVLIGGSIVALGARVRRHPLARVGLAVQVMTAAHALVDVYWVRGTPVMGWLLVGAVVTLAPNGARDPVVAPADPAVGAGPVAQPVAPAPA